MYERANQAQVGSSTAAQGSVLGYASNVIEPRDREPGSVTGGMERLNGALAMLDQQAHQLFAVLERGGVIGYPPPDVAKADGARLSPPQPGNCDLARAIHERAMAIEGIAHHLTQLTLRLQL